jgi:photosystem II stability/assembly factor-like uncharacterized protein
MTLRINKGQLIVDAQTQTIIDGIRVTPVNTSGVPSFFYDDWGPIDPMLSAASTGTKLYAFDGKWFAISKEGNVSYSIDSAKNWIAYPDDLDTGVVSPSYNSLASSGSTLIIIGPNCDSKSIDNGTTWQLIPQIELGVGNTYKCITSGSSGQFIVLGDGTAAITTNYGTTWDELPVGLYDDTPRDWVCMAGDISHTIIAISAEGIVARSLNGGTIWHPLTQYLGNSNGASTLYKDIVTDNRGIWLAVGDMCAMRSTDNGVFWANLPIDQSLDYLSIATDTYGSYIINNADGNSIYSQTTGNLWGSMINDLNISHSNPQITTAFSHRGVWFVIDNDGHGARSPSYSPGMLDRTDDSYWQSLYGTGETSAEFIYAWDGIQWSHPENFVTNDMGLKVRVAGGNAGWQAGYRPTSMLLKLNSGADEGNGGFLGGGNIYVFDSSNTPIATMGVSFSTYSQDLDVSIPLTFGSNDISYMIFESYLYNIAPIVKSIKFA